MIELTKDAINRVDSENMWDMLVSFPDYWDEAIKLTFGLALGIDKKKVRNVMIAGMGSSAISGDLIRTYARSTSPFPIGMCRNYELPAWVDDQTLLIACSYSGNTEETIFAIDEAKRKGAQVIGITSGGKIWEKAQKNEFECVKIPGGLPARAALAYSFLPHYQIFREMGFLNDDESILMDTSQFLHQQIDKFSNYQENEALNLAREIQDTLPVLYSDTSMMEAVSLRWREQLEENAKTLAYGNLLPGMNNNEIVGWEQIAHLTGRLSVIMLKDADDNPRVTRRMEITRELISEQVAGLYILTTQGENRLTRLFSLVQFADWTSLYLAFLNDVDPTPVAKSDLLKSKLDEE